jgi:cell division septal protein FtsQ
VRRESPRPAMTTRLASRNVRQKEPEPVSKRPSWRVAKTIVLCIAMVILASAVCYISPLLRVDQVTVVGASTVAPEKVIETADVEGQNILAVDRDEVARSVAQIPMVKSAVVSRRLPTEVVIAIEERRPWAVWQAQDAKYVIDEEGVVIGTATPSQNVITIVDKSNQSLRIGNRVEPKTVEMANKLTQLLPKEVGAAANRFEYSQATGLTVVSNKDWQARFGDAGNVEYKVASLKAILAAAAERRAKVTLIDLRYDGRPYYR